MPAPKKEGLDSVEPVESAAVRSERLAWESRQLDEARAELAAGKGLSGDALDAWLRRFVSGEPLRIP